MTQISFSDSCWYWEANDRDKQGGQYLTDYIEANGQLLRDRYLEIIDELGQTQVNGKTVIEHLELHSGFSFWWMSLLAEKSNYKSPQIEDCFKLLALEQILKESVPEAIYVKDLHNKNLEKSLHVLCRKLDISLNLDRGSKSWKPQIPHFIYGLAWLLRHLIRRWSLKKLTVSSWFSGENSVFLFSYFIHIDALSCEKGQFYSHQWEKLPGFLHKLGYKTNWLHHFLFSKQVANTKTAVNWTHGFNADASQNGQHGFLDSYLSLIVVSKAVLTWLRLSWVSFHLGNIQAVKLLWPVLKQDWQDSTRGKTAMQNALNFELMDSFFQDLPQQQLGIYLYEGQGWERDFINRWRQYKHGKLIAVQHATVRFWDLRYFNSPQTIDTQSALKMPAPDVIAVNGPLSLAIFQQQGYFPEMLAEAEAVRYLNIEQVNRSETKGHKRKLLVLGDIMPIVSHQMMEALESINSSLLSNFEITVKPHPGTRITKGAYSGLSFNLIDEPLYKVLEQFDVVIGANATSAALDAYLSGLTAVVFVPRGSLNMSPLREVKNVLFVSCSAELEKALENCINMKDYQPETYFWTDKHLPRWNRILN